jgi:hypothetical protein
VNWNFAGQLRYAARMETNGIDPVLHILQASISPVAMISGTGLLLLTLTNRFGRVTDRLREFAGERTAGRATPAMEGQLEIFHRRARIIRSAITASVGCMLFAGLMVMLLFAMSVFALNAGWLALVLFAVSMVFLIASLVFFLRDTQLSLRAVEEELHASRIVTAR